MEVVDVLDHPALERAADAHVVDDRQVLDQLAQSDAAGVRADRDAELGRHEQDRQDLVDAAEPAGVDLADADRLGLQQLLEHHPVVDVLAGRDPDRRHGPGDRRVAEDVVGLVGSSIQYGSMRRELGASSRSPAPTSQRWLASTASMRSGPISSRMMPPRRMSSSTSAPTFILKRGPALGERLAAQAADLVVGVAEPADRRGVRRDSRRAAARPRAPHASAPAARRRARAASGVSASVM